MSVQRVAKKTRRAWRRPRVKRVDIKAVTCGPNGNPGDGNSGMS